MTIFGDGKQTRSFCYVSDLVEAIYLTLVRKNRFETPINLGNPTEFSMNQLAENIIKLTNTKSELVYMPLPGDDPKQRNPDISLAKNLLGWEPATDLNSGLIKTVDYFTRELARG
jgi:UDP-glucuronate decarboxylase